jgi:hypothetical protein
MSWLPQDWVSFAWGAAVALAGLLASGFATKLGEDVYQWLKGKIRPPKPEPVRVEAQFAPTLFADGDCVWVAEEKLYKYEDEQYTYYPHPKTAAPCYRIASPGPPPRKEYLLAKPGAAKKAAAG